MSQIRNAVGFILGQQLASGFLGWVAGWEAGRAQQEKEALARRVAQRLLGQQLARGWTTWVSLCDDAASARMAFRGVLRRDVDLGFGYHYAALVEDGVLLR